MSKTCHASAFKIAWLFTLLQTYCLGMENMLNRQQIHSVFNTPSIFRRGRRVLCNFVKRKTNIREQSKLPVNWWKVHRDRKLSNFATNLNFDFPLLATSYGVIKCRCVMHEMPSVNINARWGGSAPFQPRKMKVSHDIWWQRWLINVHIIKTNGALASL